MLRHGIVGQAVSVCKCPARKGQVIILILWMLVLLLVLYTHQSVSPAPARQVINQQVGGASADRKFEQTAQNRLSILLSSEDVEEIAQMQKYLRLRPKLLNAAICLLVQKRRFDLLKMALRKLHEHFNGKFGYPIILFHEADFHPLRAELRSLFGSLFFQQVDLRPPAWAAHQFGNRTPEVCPWGPQVGYRHMCRFHTRLFYEHPAVRVLDYYWRLDDDSAITAPFTTDPFRALQDAGAEYGFLQGILDSPLCTHGLWNATRRYMSQNGLKAPTFFHQMPLDFCFFNNFEISRTRFWLSAEYSSFADYIDRLGGIYRYRWGDAPIKTLALSMLIPPEKIVRFVNVGYSHGNPSIPPRLSVPSLNRTVSAVSESSAKRVSGSA